jgi:hypothetical protein
LRLVAPYAADPSLRAKLWSAKISPFDLPLSGEDLPGFTVTGTDPLPGHLLIAEHTGQWLAERGWNKNPAPQTD